MSRHRAFRVAYDGRGYRGFQRQPDQPTVEGALFDAVRSLDVEVEEYAAAGRTDAGVSALAQTIRLACPEWLDAAALNGALPGSIVAWADAEVPSSFHPQYDARTRTYTYVYRGPATDLARVRACARRLVGNHEFRHLTADRSDTERTLTDLEIERADPFLLVTVTAPGFLRQQVRRIVTLLEEVGTGDRSLAEVDAILAGEPLPGHRGIAPADPEGLVLSEVAYENVAFTPHPRARQRAHARFRTVAGELDRAARVFETIADGLE